MEGGRGAGGDAPDYQHTRRDTEGPREHVGQEAILPQIVLPATFLAVVLFALLLVLVVLISWLRNHLSSSDKSQRHASLIARHPVYVMDTSKDEEDEEGKVDDFSFKIPDPPDDFKYVDEVESGLNSDIKMERDVDEPKSPPPKGGPKPETSSLHGEARASCSAAIKQSVMSRFKVPTVDPQWIMHRPVPDWRGYGLNLSSGLKIGDEGGRKSDSDRLKEKKRSSTRSPSLEKDDISPLIRPEMFDRFVYDNADRAVENVGVRSGGSSPMVEVRVQPLSTDLHVSVETLKERRLKDAKNKRSNERMTRRFGSPSDNLRINPCDNQNVEKSEMQSSPRYVDKENNPSPRFSFSPKFFGTPDSKSPNFFGTPEPKSPTFFSENHSRNTSPKYFADKSGSPRLSSSSFKSVQSPLIVDNSRECFNFDITKCADEVDNVFLAGKISPVETDNIVLCSDKTDSEKGSSPPHNVSFEIEDRLLNNFRCHEDAATRRRSFVRSNANSLNNEEDEEINDNKTEHYNNELTLNKSGTCDFSVNVDDNALEIPTNINYRRHRLKSISLDSDNAKFIEQNLGIPMVKHLRHENLYDLDSSEKDPDSDSFQDDSHDKFRRNSQTGKDCFFKFDNTEFVKDYTDVRESGTNNELDEISSVLGDETSSIQFTETKPRFSPKEFDASNSGDESSPKSNKNFRNLTIDLNKKDEELQKELVEFDCFHSPDEKRMTPKTPTLKVKATSLDSSETLNLSLPQSNTLQVPQNSISVPNTPKRQLKRALSQKSGKLTKGHYTGNLNEISVRTPEVFSGRKLFINSKFPNIYMDSGIFLKENHAPLMPFQGSKYPGHRASGSCNFSRKMGSFDENTVEMTENTNPNAVELIDGKLVFSQPSGDSNLLGSNLSNFKQNLSVSSTNLKTLPEGVPSYDFDIQPEEKSSKKTLLQRRGSNQSLTINLDGTGNNTKFSTLSLQSSNLSLASFGASSHNLSNIKNSASNFSLNTDNRQKKNLLERRNSNTSLTLNLDCNPHRGIYSTSNCNLQGSHHSISQESQGHKKCLLQRRGSNTSLTLNLQGVSNSNLNRCTSNSSLNVHADNKPGQKKGLLERRSSNTSLTLNINASSGNQFDNNRVLSVSNYNLAGISRHNSNQSITNETKKNLVPREIDIDNFNPEMTDGKRDKHRKSLSTENLFPKSYKCRVLHGKNDCENVVSFGSHDNLWSSSYMTESLENINAGEQNLTYICGDQENEMIYAFGDRQHIESVGPIRNITTKPLSPHSTSADFKTYLANIQHLQNASNSLTRQQLKDLHSLFKGGYAKTDSSSSTSKNSPLDSIASTFKKLDIHDSDNSAISIAEYQKTLLRTLHQEFWDLPTNFQEKPMVFGSHPKNRYRSILPNEHSRVILRAEIGELEEGYINANYIKGHEYSKNAYIATQGPLQNTLFDFWLMVYQNGIKFHQQDCMRTNEDRHFGSPQGRNTRNQESQGKTSEEESGVQKIVMLTNFIENGRSKCEKYFPVDFNQEMIFKQFKYSNESGNFGDSSLSPEVQSKNVSEDSNMNYFKVKNIATINKNGYSIRKLNIEYKNKVENKEEEESLKIVTDPGNIDVEDTIVVYHYWFDNWADHKCPEDVQTLLEFCLDILRNEDPDFQAAGTFKRTRTFEITRSLFDKSSTYSDFHQEIVKPTNLDLDITGISKERRLSAFQLAKAFFDEAAKANSSSEDCSKVGIRKNSLASRLDVPKQSDLTVRRESTGRIDRKKKDKIELAATHTFKAPQRSVPKNCPPIIVHCSAGIGRTGCLIGTLNGLKQLKADQKVDILGIVCNMRLNRGGMVQNSEQYELIHKVLCLYEDLGLPDID